MFENCFPNTLDTTVDSKSSTAGRHLRHHGDIDAMWLRDSTAQVWPYLPLMKDDAQLQQTHCRRHQPSGPQHSQRPLRERLL